METQYNHKVLIVDDEEAVGKVIGKILKRYNIDCVYINSGVQAFELIKKEETPFSLIISDYHMAGMNGAQFLEQAMKITPETVRFLITGFIEMPNILNAINKGSISRFISKSGHYHDLIEIVKYGLKQFELSMESKKLVSLSNERNKKLYELNCNYMETIKQHNELAKKMDEKILFLRKQIEEKIQDKNTGKTLKQLEHSLRESNLLENDKFNSFYNDVIKQIYEQFRIIAERNEINISLT